MKIYKTVGLIFLSVGILLFTVCMFLTYSTYTFVQKAERSTGQIIGTKDGYPIFRFTDTQGNIREQVSGVSTSQNITIGDDISIIFSKENGDSAVIHSFWYLYLPSIILGFLGCIFSILGYIFYTVSMRESRSQKNALSYEREIQASNIQVVPSPFFLNGRPLPRLQVQWQDPETQKIHIFYSRTFEYDPTPFIKDTLSIKIDAENYKKYWVDTSDFPELA